MSRTTVRRVTAAAMLALALLCAGPGTAAAGALEVAVPALRSAGLVDRFLDWLGGLWSGTENAASSDKSIILPGGEEPGTTSSSPTGSSATVGGNPGEQGATIDPDG